MTIEYAILGMLSWKPLSGYDIKGMMQDSPIMYWSGNNNQIYKALVQLLKKNYVTYQVQYQDSAPNKKIYDITDSGLEALNAWVSRTTPEAPEFKKTFLIQLSWAGQLEPERLNALIVQYEEILEQQIAMGQEEARRQKNFPNRSPQERYVWEMIYDNLRMSCETELQWVRQLRGGLAQTASETQWKGGMLNENE